MLTDLNFDEIDIGVIDRLVENGVPEGPTLEFKRDQYTWDQDGRKEFLKDVVSLANTFGGHLIIGVREEDGVASEVTPLTIQDIDSELLRMESLISDGVEPRISGIRQRYVHANEAKEGGIFLIWVPRSWTPPHRVKIAKTSRFYARNSAGVYEPSVEQLRTLFTYTASSLDRVVAFRAERLALLDVNDGHIPLAQGKGRFVLHLAPLGGLAGQVQQVDLDQVYSTHPELWPIAADGLTPKINFQGYASVRGGPECHGYTQVFRNGSIEATKVNVWHEHEGNRLLSAAAFDEWLMEPTGKYLDVLKKIGVPTPICLMVTLQGVHGAALAISNDQRWSIGYQPVTQTSLEFEPIIIEQYADRNTYKTALRPVCDALWNTAGYSKSQYFDDRDQWIGPPR